MECKKCGGDMYREERVGDTAKADVSEEIVWCCEDCGHEFVRYQD